MRWARTAGSAGSALCGLRCARATSARAMYERLGFVEINRRRSYYPAGAKREDAVVMSLALSPQEAP